MGNVGIAREATNITIPASRVTGSWHQAGGSSWHPHPRPARLRSATHRVTENR